jgi:hypothetical protein
MVTELVNVVIGVETHRDINEVEIAFSPRLADRLQRLPPSWTIDGQVPQSHRTVETRTGDPRPSGESRKAVPAYLISLPQMESTTQGLFAGGTAQREELHTLGLRGFGSGVVWLTIS